MSREAVLARAAEARKLRALPIDAARRAAGGEYANAATLYHDAIACCIEGGLIVEEAIVRIAFGGMCLAAGLAEVAAKSYERAAAVAQRGEAWPLACQAWLGAGGVHRMRKKDAAAAHAYETAAAMAARAEMPLLHTEALRLSGVCHLGGDPQGTTAKPWSAQSVLDPERNRVAVRW